MNNVKYVMTAFFILLFLSFAPYSQAQTRYVTDEFEVMMRTGPSVQNKILEVLKSGKALEVIQADAGNDYSKVRSPKGEEGFILSRYLVDLPSAKDRLVKLEEQLNVMRSKPEELQSLLVQSQEENQDLISQNTSLTGRLEVSDKALKRIKLVSADAVNISERNEDLEGEVQNLLLQLDDLRIQNQVLKDESDRMFTMIGGGFILFGIFLGWILSISGRRDRSSWGA